jgi:hypothetical protein
LEPKLLLWVDKISEENKRGLRVLNKVLEVDGKKKFKKEDHGNQLKHDLIVKDVYAIPFEDAQKEYRKLTNKSNYAQSYGTTPSKTNQEFDILRHKKFS